MSSETERITYEVMARHDTESCAEHPSEDPRQRTEGHHRAAIDLHFTNKAYMELERPSGFRPV